MLKSEVLEIKKQFRKDNPVIGKLCGCYVDAQKEIQLISKEAFSMLPEEDAQRYLDIFKKTLSGTIGKNLLNLDFSSEAEEAGSTHALLLKLRESGLKEDVLLEELYQKIIETYDVGGGYYIIVIDLIYDIPLKGSDKMRIVDASEEVYHSLLVSICPIKLSKGGLKYYAEFGKIENAVKDLMVDMPMHGFLFPVFNDRTTDIHSLLYYSKDQKNLKEDFIASMFALSAPLSAMEQKKIIQESIAQAFGEDCDYMAIQDFHETLLTAIEEKASEPEPLVLDKKAITRLLGASGAPDEAIIAYEKNTDNDIEVLADNIIDKKKFEVKAAGISIKAEPEFIHKIQTKMVGGVKCLVINIEDNIEVNGVMVKS